MTNDSKPNETDSTTEKRGERIMWIGTAVIVLLIIGMMGANVLFREAPSATGEVSSQSRSAR